MGSDFGNIGANILNRWIRVWILLVTIKNTLGVVVARAIVFVLLIHNSGLGIFYFYALKLVKVEFCLLMRRHKCFKRLMLSFFVGDVKTNCQSGMKFRLSIESLSKLIKFQRFYLMQIVLLFNWLLFSLLLRFNIIILIF